MRRGALAIRHLTTLIVGLLIASTALAQSTPEVVERLTKLRNLSHGRLNDINQRIQQTLGQSARVPLDKSQTEKKSYLEFENQMNELASQYQEYQLRLDFYNRLIHKVQARYPGHNLKGFLAATLVEMARVEATTPAASSQLIRFMTYLAKAVEQVPERTEDTLDFVEGYINFSSVSRPSRPSEYFSQRDFTNGIENESARSVSPEEVGDLVDQQLQKLEAMQAKLEQQKAFELRRPILKGVSQEIEEKSIRDTDINEWLNHSVYR